MIALVASVGSVLAGAAVSVIEGQRRARAALTDAGKREAGALGGSLEGGTRQRGHLGAPDGRGERYEMAGLPPMPYAPKAERDQRIANRTSLDDIRAELAEVKAQWEAIKAAHGLR
jgi:hypothetical protein